MFLLPSLFRVSHAQTNEEIFQAKVVEVAEQRDIENHQEKFIVAITLFYKLY